jgi:ferredoxin
MFPWTVIRRGSQAIALGAFALGCIAAALPAVARPCTGILTWWFTCDPLLALGMLLAGAAAPALAWSASIIVLTMVTGRSFCGWLCPMGAVLDGWSAAWRKWRPSIGGVPLPAGLRHTRFVVLAAILAAIPCGLGLAGWFDPLTILGRALGGGAIQAGAWTWLGLGILLGLLALELVQRRAWCRNVCPLGALLGLIGRYALVKRLPGRTCTNCGTCRTSCRMGAFRDTQAQSEACIRCGDCVDGCHARVARFAPRLAVPAGAAPVDLSRRAFLGVALGGAAVPLAARFIPGAPALHVAKPPMDMLRPPGVYQHQEVGFLDRCTRCGACLQVCPTGGLQPSAWEAGLDGVFAPMLIPRAGACDIACTRCGDVCPTGAIPKQNPAYRADIEIGKAWVDKTRCLPYVGAKACSACEQACPLKTKAIAMVAHDVLAADGTRHAVLVPGIDHQRCVGCGWCEHACPVAGEAGVRVFRKGRIPSFDRFARPED